MSKKHLSLGLILSITALIATGCVVSLGGGGRGSPGADPTIGQELIDLKKAKDSGAISGEEYENQKKKVMSQ
jgi:hypothetical protein